VKRIILGLLFGLQSFMFGTWANIELDGRNVSVVALLLPIV